MLSQGFMMFQGSTHSIWICHVGASLKRLQQSPQSTGITPPTKRPVYRPLQPKAKPVDQIAKQTRRELFPSSVTYSQEIVEIPVYTEIEDDPDEDIRVSEC